MFDAKQLRHMPCLHWKHFPSPSANFENGNMQFTHLPEFEGSQVKHGEAHIMHVFEDVSLNGGRHYVQFVTEPSHLEHGDRHLTHILSPEPEFE